MTKLEMVMNAVEDMGYKPEVDDDGDVFFRYQMKNIYVMMGDEEENYVVVLMPQFIEVEEGEETLSLALCNKLTRDVKLAKVYIDNNLKTVTSSCEFFYTDETSIRNNMEHSLEILGMVRSAYYRAKAELSEE